MTSPVPSPVPSVPLSVPPPGRAALARARRIVHEGGPTRRDLVYRAYVAVLLGAMIVAPLLTGLTSSVPPQRAEDLVWSLRLWCVAPLALAALAPTHLGPVITSAGELHYLVDGPFGARRVLLGRTWTVLVAVLVGVGAVALVVAAGLGLGGGAVVATTVWAMGQASLVYLALLGIQTRWSRVARALTLVTSAGLAALVVTGTRAGRPLGTGPDALAAAFLGAAVCAVAGSVPLLLDRVQPGVLAHDVRVRHLIRTGLATGDAGALAVHDGPRRRHFRGRTVPMSGGILRRTAAVDVSALMRSPWRTGAAVAALVAVGAWIGTPADPPAGPTASLAAVPAGAGGVPVALAAPLALLATQWAFAVLSRPLTDVLESLGAGRLDPSSFPRMLAAHLALPWSSVLVVTACAAGVTAWVGGDPAQAGAWSAVPGAAVLVALVGPCMSLAVVATSSPPLVLLTPTSSPFGDTSSLVVVAWMLRGLAPAAVLAALLGAASVMGLPEARALWTGSVVLAVGCAIAAAWRLRSLARTDRRARGEAPARD